MSTLALRATVVCSLSLLALALLVPRVGADHHDPPVAAVDLAVLADRFDAGTDFHDWLLPRLGTTRAQPLRDRRNRLAHPRPFGPPAWRQAGLAFRLPQGKDGSSAPASGLPDRPR